MKKMLWIVLLLAWQQIEAAEQGRPYPKEIRIERSAQTDSAGYDFVGINYTDALESSTIGKLLEANFKAGMPTIIARVLAENDDVEGKTFYNYWQVVPALTYVYGEQLSVCQAPARVNIHVDKFWNDMRAFTRYHSREIRDLWAYSTTIQMPAGHEFRPGEEFPVSKLKGPQNLFDLDKRRIKSKIRFYVAFGKPDDVTHFTYLGDDETLTERGPTSEREPYWSEYRKQLDLLFTLMHAQGTQSGSEGWGNPIVFLAHIALIFENPAVNNKLEALRYYAYLLESLLKQDLGEATLAEFDPANMIGSPKRINIKTLPLATVLERIDKLSQEVGGDVKRKEEIATVQPPAKPVTREPAAGPSAAPTGGIAAAAAAPSGERVVLHPDDEAKLQVELAQRRRKAQPPALPTTPIPGTAAAPRPAQGASVQWAAGDAASKRIWEGIVALLRNNKDRANYNAWPQTEKNKIDELGIQAGDSNQALYAFLTPLYSAYDALNSAQRQQFLQTINAIAPLLFGSASLTPAQKQEVKKVISEQFSDQWRKNIDAILAPRM